MKVLFAALLGTPLLFCQPRTEFEVASVKPSAPITNANFNVGVHIDGAMVRCNYLTLVNYLTMAYDVKDYQIDGPEWMTSEHFDIDAKRPEGVEGEKALRAMMASLIEDRFRMKMHRETRDLPAYALVVGKGGLKIKELEPDEAGDNLEVDVNVTGGGRGGTVVDLGGRSTLTYGLNKLEAKKVTIPSIIDSPGKFLDRPVVDNTGLTGRYKLLQLDYSIEELKNLGEVLGRRCQPHPRIWEAIESRFSSPWSRWD